MYGGDGGEGEDVIFYLTVYNEPTVQPAMPEHVEDQQEIGRASCRERVCSTV